MRPQAEPCSPPPRGSRTLFTVICACVYTKNSERVPEDLSRKLKADAVFLPVCFGFCRIPFEFQLHGTTGIPYFVKCFASPRSSAPARPAARSQSPRRALSPGGETSRPTPAAPGCPLRQRVRRGQGSLTPALSRCGTDRRGKGSLRARGI